jgi:multiple sugar transport system ATP-binding protein
MNAGRIEQIGTPQELYHKPRTRFVAGFIGSPAMNFVPCRLDHKTPGLSVRLTDVLTFSVPANRIARYQPHVGKDLVFGLRPEHITDPRYERSELHPFTVTLDVVEPMGMETMVYFKLDGAEVCGRVEPGSVSAAGQPMGLCADLNQMHLIDPQSDLVL